MIKVSVIMPSLNVASYIRESIESVVNQTLPEIEILCVDAGSTDGTLEILREYEQRDPRVKVIVSDKRSYGYQMNLGIACAKGEYIGIVETDDYVMPDMYETLFVCAKEQNADFVKSDFDVFSTIEDGTRLFLNYSLNRYSSVKYNELISYRDYMSNRQTVDIFVWNGIYKAAFLREQKIQFQETSGAAFQDCGFRYQVAMLVQRGYFINSSFYRYRRDNINSSTYNPKGVLFNLSECRFLMNVIEEKKIDDLDRLEFFAREMVVIALAPYKDLMTWNKPSNETDRALYEFQEIFREFMQKGWLGQNTMTEYWWDDLQCFMSDVDQYREYVSQSVNEIKEVCRKFIMQMQECSEIVIFGSGLLGSAAYCFMRLNGISQVIAFADNASDKWECIHMGKQICRPEKIIQDYPHACYLIANARNKAEIQTQLHGLGVADENIYNYPLGSSPMFCTNCLIGRSDEENRKQNV